MNRPFHSFSELFAQLGLPNDAAAIAQFIERHAPLREGLRLEEAAFWTPPQARFLRDAVCDDSDWSEVADQLSAALRRA